MVKLLHSGDFHLDSPFSGLSPQEAKDCRENQRHLVEDLIQLATDSQCDCVLLTGDLFDGKRVYGETLDFLRRTFGRCSCPIFIAPGNHDYVNSGSPYLGTWPDNVHIFKSHTIEGVSQGNFTVWGAGFTASHAPSLLEGFSATGEGLHIMAIHGDVAPDSVYNPITKGQIAASGLQYLALGHTHKAQSLLQEGNTYYGWPGCLMGRGFDELGQKGAYLVSVSQEKTQAEFIPLGQRTYEIITVSVGENPEEDIRKALPENPIDKMVRVILEGQCPPLNLQELRTAIAPLCYGLQIKDRTTPPVDVWANVEEDTLKGLFLKTLQQGEDKELCQLAATFGLACMEGREPW